MASEPRGPLPPNDPNQRGPRGLLANFAFNHAYSRPGLKLWERGLMSVGVLCVLFALATHGTARHVAVIVAVVLIVVSTWLPPAVDGAMRRRDQRGR